MSQIGINLFDYLFHKEISRGLTTKEEDELREAGVDKKKAENKFPIKYEEAI